MTPQQDRLRPLEEIRRTGALLERLYRCHPKFSDDRVAAAQTLGEAPPARSEAREWACGALREVLKGAIRENDVRAGLRGLTWPFIIGVGTGLFMAAAAPFDRAFASASLWTNAVTNPLTFCLLTLMVVLPVSAPFAVPAALRRSRRSNDRVRAACAGALADLGDFESIPFLCHALFERGEELRTQAAQSLMRLLPLVTEEHNGRLPEPFARALGRALRYRYHELNMQTLWAIQRAGPPLLIPAVKRAAAHLETKPARDEAERTLRILESRADLTARTGTLLRPSEAEQTEVLLRPAGPTHTDTEQLLHPASSE